MLEATENNDWYFLNETNKQKTWKHHFYCYIKGPMHKTCVRGLALAATVACLNPHSPGLVWNIVLKDIQFN